jgi:hypothetical protein
LWQIPAISLQIQTNMYILTIKNHELPLFNNYPNDMHVIILFVLETNKKIKRIKLLENLDCKKKALLSRRKFYKHPFNIN